MIQQTGESNAAFVARVSESFRMPALTFSELRSLSSAFNLIPFADAAKRRAVALRGARGELYTVLGNPADAATLDWLEEKLRVPFAYRVAHPEDIAAYLAQQEQGLRAMDGVGGPHAVADAPRGGAEELSLQAIGDTESPVVRLVNSTLYDALKSGASDIHFETAASGLSVKYRIDGVLAPATVIEGADHADQVLSRIKVMAELDIAERRVPQDGRFKVRRNGREIDIRVSVMPSVFGEDAVLRILDKQALSDQLRGLTLDQLGFEPDSIATLRRLSTEPYGMLLATGPTGSGKTTTLYAVISEVNRGLDKIVTIEDPVEYQLAGVLQIPVNEKKGLTFARGLRSILRHDPDRIMVGEIRDPETAEIAVQAALTGHLVYTTVHANNVFDVIGRFVHMGVDRLNFVSALNAVLAQRLVRLVCRDCGGKGCAACRGTGFKGRRAIGELLVMNDELRELIAAREPVRRVKEAARRTGMRTLRETALELVRRGGTTMEEADRVTFVAQ